MSDPSALMFGDLPADEAEREIYAHILSRNPEHDFEPTLDRVQEACDLLGNPQHAFKVVHITGTNGKTSTARMTESLVREHGLRTGLFTSPHLTSVRERIQIDGEPISQDEFIRLWQEVAPILHMVDARSTKNGGPRLSFFEVLVVLAYAAFADAPVDVAIIEVGMGGQWDATNVADGEVAVVTPISMDHAEWLGDDLVGIAQEKSGIIKDGATAVIAQQSEAVTPVLLTALAEREAQGLWESSEFEVVDRQPGVGGQMVTLRTPGAVYTEIFIPLYGEHQAHNALLALVAAEALMADGGEITALSGETVEAAFGGVLSPGRLEAVRTSPMILVDVAHNPAGVDALVNAIEESFLFQSVVGVVGVLEDKDAEGILAGLEPLLDHVVITASASPRALSTDDLGAVARRVFGEERVQIAQDLPDAIDRAVQTAEQVHDMGAGILVTGSVTVVAETRILVGADKRKGAGQAR